MAQPFPGKLDLQGQIASAEADVELWKYEEVRRELVAELRMAYYDLFLAQKTNEILEKYDYLWVRLHPSAYYPEKQGK